MIQGSSREIQGSSREIQGSSREIQSTCRVVARCACFWQKDGVLQLGDDRLGLWHSLSRAAL